MSKPHTSPRSRWWLPCLLALGGPLQASEPSPVLASAQPILVAVLYVPDDESQPGQFSEILRGIRSQSAVNVIPVELGERSRIAVVPLSRQLHNMVAMAGGEGQIAVVYPDIGEPYRGIFTKIIEGIEAKAKNPVVSYAVGSNPDAEALKATLRSKGVRVVIALGRQGMQAADSLAREFGVVVGGVTAVPEDEARRLSVVSLSPDPALLFARLKDLMPATRRVLVVYDPGQNTWLLRLARAAARSQGLELVAYEAHDLKGAVRHYQEILAHADATRDALWLPQDAITVEDSVVLPMVLRGAWDNNLAVFSSSFGHVRRGVLFSLYPDNLGLGQNLASSALGYLSSGEPSHRGVAPLRDVQAAINLRTAKHLGLNLSNQAQRGFSVVFTDQ